VNEALGALYRHPRQILLAWYRYAIYDALMADCSHASYARRAWLDVVSAQYVLFCWPPYARASWHAAWLQPAELLGMAEQTLRGAVDIGAIQHTLTRAEALADLAGEPPTSAQYPAWCVFEAALRALRSAYICRNLCAAQPRAGTCAAAMVDLDDASRFAAIAIAGDAQASGASRTRAQRRAAAEAAAAAQLRQTFFWEWWLREAIPQACRLG
jgi:hypothetical protein